MRLVRGHLLKSIFALTVLLFTVGCAAPLVSVERKGVVTMTGLQQDSDLIFIHGYGGSACSWSLIDDDVRQFASPSYLELVGFGKHEPPEGFDFSINAQAEHLASRLQDVDLSGSTIVAHSMGAAVVLVAMLDHGFSPSKVILVDPLAYQQSLPFFIRGQTIPIISGVASRVLPPAFQVDLVLNAIYFDRSNINQAIRGCYINEFKTPFHRATLMGTARQLADFNADAYVSRYGDLQAEFHVIWGRNDPLISSILLPQLVNDLGAVSSHLIDNCGHAPHEECPSQFVTLLETILD
jgi:pimeloyl-ACP methyl ester carboxylesterase